ncbi:MAG: aminotransferase class V-fold PLP-dependent enzyme [Verrucomicrobiota bacterium]
MSESLYLDAIATTRISDSVRERMMPYLDQNYGLPAGAHTMALDARDAVEASREECLEFIMAPERSTCVFTGSGTEANNLGLLGFVRARKQTSRVITTQIEHPSILGACDILEQEGHEIVRLEVDKAGRLSPTAAAAVLSQGDLLVTHLTNYDLGTRQNVIELGRMTQKVHAMLMVDATFGAGWNEFSMQEAGADLVTWAPHRFFGPTGVGILVARAGIHLQPLYYGGNQEHGWRPGSGSVAHMVGAGAACQEAQKRQGGWIAAVSVHQLEFMRQLSEQLTEFQLNGAELGPDRDPHHLSFSIRGVEGEAVLLNLDLKGVQLTSNTGCVTAADKISPVLKAIGVEQELATGTLVAGLLPDYSSKEICRAVELLVTAVQHVRSMSQSWHQFQAGRSRKA